MKLEGEQLAKLEQDVGAEMLPVIMQSFAVEFVTRRDQLQAACEVADARMLAEHAHALKSTARTVGLQELGNGAAEIESLVHQGEPEQALRQAPGLLEQCAAAADEVNRWLAAHAPGG